MESIQKLFNPSLDDLLTKIQQTNVPNNVRKIRKRPSPSDETSPRKKRNRITFDSFQVDEMEKVFAGNQYPDAISRDKLATKIQLDEERVQIWFQNRRAKYRRELRHTYHPYEPPKNIDIPCFKKVLISHENATVPADSSVNEIKSKASPDKDHPSMTNKKTNLSVRETEDQTILMRALVDSSDDSSSQLTSSLSSLLCANQNADKNVCIADSTHTDTALKEQQEAFEQLDPENVGLLLWALSSIFNVQNDTTV